MHLGHLVSARATAAAFELDRVLLVLSARPPHKAESAHASVDDRLRMLHLATRDDGLIEVCDIEVKRPGASYTYDTLVDIGRDLPTHELFLILGIDAYREIDSWHRPADILLLANLVVTTRAGHDTTLSHLEPPFAARQDTCYDPDIGCHVHTSGHRIVGYELNGPEISASEIRRRSRDHIPIKELAGSRVAAYIREHELYGAGAP